MLAGAAVGVLASRTRPRILASGGALALGVAIVALVAPGPPESSAARVLFAAHRNYEVPAWRAAGRHLARIAPEGASVACVPIGAVGYESGLVVVDMLGLVDPHIARAENPTGGGWAGHEKRDGAYVLGREPTYLLLGNVRALDSALPLDHAEFVRVRNPYVEAREGDIYVPALARDYVPEVARLDDVDGRDRPLFLHYLRRR